MLGTLNKDSILEFFRLFSNFTVSPRSTIKSIEHLLKPGIHVWITIDQYGQLVTRSGYISLDDRRDISDDLVNSHMFQYLLDTGIPFLITIEVCYETNLTNVEIILGSEANAIRIAKKNIK